MTTAESYAYCSTVARAQARNFYYSFVLWDDTKKNAMCAVYAFMRYCDDLSDGPAQADHAMMEQWRTELTEALKGHFGPNPCWPVFYDTVQRFQIPHQYFYEMIDVVSSDLTPRRIAMGANRDLPATAREDPGQRV